MDLDIPGGCGDYQAMILQGHEEKGTLGWYLIGPTFVYFTNSDEWFDKTQFYTRGADATVGGKTCKVYTSIFDGHVIYKWKNIAMRIIQGNGQLLTDVISVVENVPDNACTTAYKIPTWIEQ